MIFNLRFFNALFTNPLTSEYKQAALGTAITIPKIPNRSPKTKIESNTQIPGKPTEFPTTLG